MHMEMGHMDMGSMMGSMWLWSLVGLLLLVALVVLAVWAVRRFTAQPGTRDARRILEERFARGEIDADEFGSRLRTLEG
ncbi:MAG TPA: SHOCT domain-containing protein [Actinomycetota bacterium]|nr:SHOCT domain-containing protein [Actinomycetota bacterium]